MQLVYRGSIYTCPPAAIASPELEITGQYRGAPVTFRSSVGVSQPNSVAMLMYRGTPYLRFR